MKILCLGNNTSDTDEKASRLAIELGTVNLGLISTVDNQPLPGLYHTSTADLNSAQILELVEKFDKLILLDHKELDNLEYLDYIKSLIKKVDIEFESQVDLTTKSYFEELLDTNKSFCILPFIEVTTNDDFTTVCCRSETPVSKLDSITDWKQNIDYKEIRDKMLKGEQIPEHCSHCYRYEQVGMKGDRHYETLRWTSKLNLKSIEDLEKINSPVYYEVRTGNTCNLQCRMCFPQYSNLIEKEYVKLGWHDPKVTYHYSNFDFVKFDNLEKLLVSGGEPTALTDLYDFMIKCVDVDHTDFEFTIQTNAEKISEKFFNLANKFSNLDFTISLDGYQKVNDYVRWNSHWDNIINNAKRLNQRHKITFNTVISIYNVSTLYQLLFFIEQEFPTVEVCLHQVESKDDILNEQLYPINNNVLDSLEKIKSLKLYQQSDLVKNRIDSLLENYHNQETIDIAKLTKFFEFNDTLDKSRGCLLKDYIPELEQYRELCYNKV